jgi:3-oxocholest-4-en-26-oyl-CoA dehydrogenase beta subunit
VDFSLSEEQEAVVETAAKVFEGHLSDERRAEVDAEGEGIDRKLWSAMAGANLLGLPFPGEHGGSGLGFAEVSVLLEEVGRAAAPVPVWASVLLAGMPVARFGSEALKGRLLPRMASGELIATAALIEAGTEVDHPETTARRSDGGWTIDGSKLCVPAGTVAGVVLVPARIGAREIGVFVVDPGAGGVTITRLETTTGIPEARLDFNRAAVSDDDVVGSPEAGGDVLAWLVLHATSGLCSLMAGTCQAALRLTAEHAVTRKQFDRAIATFQAVGQRAADAYVDSEAVTLTARQAAWRLAEGLPAEEQVAIAKFWAAEGGQRVVHAAQHIHGGVGVDRSYPLHRYFLAAKQYELTLGGATSSLLRLGAMMADQVV